MLEAAGHDGGCISGGVAVGVEVGGVGSSGVHLRCCISFVQRSGSDAVVCFCVPVKIEGVAYSVGGGGKKES